MFYQFRAYGVPVSLNNRDKLRLVQGFETKEEAQNRTILEADKVKKVYFK